MSIKSRGRRLGRSIRRITGLPFTEAMGIAKLIVRERQRDVLSKFPEVVTFKFLSCGDGCCDSPEFTITGPRDSIVTMYVLSYSSVMREIDITERLRENPNAVIQVPLPREYA